MFSRLAVRGARGVRCYSTSAFRSTSVLTNNKNRAFAWNRYIENGVALKSEDFSGFKEVESIVTQWREIAETEYATPKIDWAAWEKEISTPGVVAELKKEYEADLKSFEGQFKVDPAEVQKANNEIDEILNSIEKTKAIKSKQAAKYKKELDAAVAFRDNIENAGIEDYYRHMPGVEEEMRNYFWEGKYTRHAEEKKLQQWDPAPLAAAIRADPKNVPASLNPPHIVQQAGALNLNDLWAEAKKDLDELYGADPTFKNPFNEMKLDVPVRQPFTHELLPLLADRKRGAPVFGAPVPGEEHHH